MIESDRNLYQATISTFVYALKKVWVNILSGAAVMERPDFLNEKKTVKVINLSY